MGEEEAVSLEGQLGPKVQTDPEDQEAQEDQERQEAQESRSRLALGWL